MPKLVMNTVTGQVFEVVDGIKLPDYFVELTSEQQAEVEPKPKKQKRKE